MAKSAYTLKEVVGLVHTTLARYYSSYNFDRQHTLKMMQLASVEMSSMLMETFGADVFDVVYTVDTPPVSRSDLQNVWRYDISAFQPFVSIIRSVITQYGPVDIVPYTVMRGSILSTEFEKQPLASLLNDEVYVSYGSLTNGPIEVVARANTYINDITSENLICPIETKFISLLIIQTVIKIMVTDGKTIPDQLNATLELAIKMITVNSSTPDEREDDKSND